jgi:hypothetical protein
MGLYINTNTASSERAAQPHRAALSPGAFVPATVVRSPHQQREGRRRRSGDQQPVDLSDSRSQSGRPKHERRHLPRADGGRRTPGIAEHPPAHPRAVGPVGQRHQQHFGPRVSPGRSRSARLRAQPHRQHDDLQQQQDPRRQLPRLEVPRRRELSRDHHRQHADGRAVSLGRQSRNDGRGGRFGRHLHRRPGTFAVNGVSIRGTVAADDTLSTTLQDGSAIAKAAAINDSTKFTGVRAIVEQGRGREQRRHRWRHARLDELHPINGEIITGVIVQSATPTTRWSTPSTRSPPRPASSPRSTRTTSSS